MSRLPLAPRDHVEARTPNSRDPRPLVRLSSVGVTYTPHASVLGKRPPPIHAVRDLSLEISRGQSLGILGQTGAGKSTVTQLLMGMVTPTRGSVEIDGVDLAGLRGAQRRRIFRLRQVVLQDPFSSLDPRMRVRDIISEPLRASAHPAASTRKATDSRVAELLQLVGLPPQRLAAYPHEFSGGQRQRISIARALAPEPALIVLDEPTSALDVSIRAQILALLRQLRDRLELTYLVISHDVTTVAYLSHATAVMYAGRIIEMGPTPQLLSTPRHPYTQHLLSCVPRRDVNFLADAPSPTSTRGRPDPSAEHCPYRDSCRVRHSLDERSARRCDQVPPLAAVAPDAKGHLVACHFVDEARDRPRSSDPAAFTPPSGAEAEDQTEGDLP